MSAARRALAIAAILLAPAIARAEEVRSYAVVVANNRAADASLADLRYADDDGARWTELLALSAERTELLSVLDAETQSIFPDLARRARAPSLAELERALASTFAEIERGNTDGARTVLYFVFVGHGSVAADGEGVVHLLDGHLSRSALYQQVIARSPARFNHVIIDACNAYLMVARRGGTAPSEAAIEEAIRGFVGREGLARHPNTGVFVSTTRAAEVHEWSRFEAGIFSHEVRSALAGAADVDGDGAVTYDEARAFVGAANVRISDAKAKLEAYAAAPALHRAEPLFDRARVKSAPLIRIPAAIDGHRWLEDARGVRFADFHLAPDHAIALTVVPSTVYFLRDDEEEIRIPLEAQAEVDAGALPRERVQLALRGAEAITFQRDLFAVPFGRAYYEGFRAAVPPPPSRVVTAVEDEGGLPLSRVAAGGLAVGAVAAVVGGVLFGISAGQLAESHRSAIGSEAEIAALRADSESAARTANILYVAAGGMLAGAALLWFLPDLE